MKVATWNVNSLRARLEHVTSWLQRRSPDVLCMQETKVEDEHFPHEELARLGYSVSKAGQKSYNGVAIASRVPLSDVRVGLNGAGPDDDKRVISAVAQGVRIVGIYAPNGKAVGSEAFVQKLAWYRQLRATLDALPVTENGTIVCGDFNIAPEERDVYDPELFRGQLHFHPDEHAVLKHLTEHGLTDLFRLHNASGKQYSWWDYRAGSFRRNLGLRIDYILGTEAVASRCREVLIDKEERAQTKPSDHCPVMAELS
jgi:exodeoxyribonuclease-3